MNVSEEREIKELYRLSRYPTPYVAYTLFQGQMSPLGNSSQIS